MCFTQSAVIRARGKGYARPPAGPRARKERRSVRARAISSPLGARFRSANELVRSIANTIDACESKTDVVSGVADCLTQWVEAGGVLPEEFVMPSSDAGYGRRALHVDQDGQFGIIVMTWSPGQKTAIHDHDDMWCVECVYSGRISVLAYDVEKVAEADGLFRLTPAERGEAGRGEAGMLIPPKDIHELSNALDSSLSCTIHVYGGHMEQCQVFTPVPWMDEGGQIYRKESRSLYFTRCPDWTCDHI